MWTRREFAKALGASGVAAAFPPAARASADPDVSLRLVAAPARAQIFAGDETPVLRFTGEVLSGRPDALKASGSYLGPTLELQRGERVRIEFENRLAERSIVHWHGMIVPDVADGHPRFAIAPGGRYVYEFTVQNPAGTYLYHPHPHGRTGHQVYHGLAGLLIVREPAERDMGLPSAPFELPLVIQDRRVADGNRLAFKQSMMDDMNGVLGDTVLVNGQPDAAFKVAPRSYRMRLANVSNARIYKLAWSDGRPLTVIGTDNGLLSAEVGPQERPYVVLAPFERIELLEDFGRWRGGADLALVSQSFSVGSGMMGGGMMGGGMMGGGMMGGGMMGGGMMGGGMMGGGMMGGNAGRGMGGMMGGGMGGMMGGGAQQGDELVVARFAVSGGSALRAEPLRLTVMPPAREEDPALELSTELTLAHMRGLLNGRGFAMGSVVAADEQLPVGRPVVWTFTNPAAQMMAMPHPMHIHGVRFRVIERSGGGRAGRGLADGIVDAGYKDTFLVLPGERVRILVTPTEPGLFMYHCHNLEHEDGGMMRNVLFESKPGA